MHIELTEEIAAKPFERTFVHSDECGPHSRRLRDVVLYGTGLDQSERGVTIEFETRWARIRDQLLGTSRISSMPKRIRRTCDGGT
jgi:hypothetical protein